MENYESQNFDSKEELKFNNIEDEVFNNFKKVGFFEPLILAIKDNNFKKATIVQKRAIPLVNEDLNLIVAAPTGSGKTLIYINRILQTVKDNKPNQVLILVPTRELTLQVKNMIEQFSTYRPINVLSISAFENLDNLKNKLEHSQVVVATPTSIKKVLEKNENIFENLHLFILDEMDLIIKDFFEDLEFIISKIPRKRQTLMFSATVTKEIAKFAQKYTKKIQRVIISEKEHKKNLTYITYEIKPDKKLSLLSYILENYNFGQMLIFVNRKELGEFIKKNLKHLKLEMDFIHKELSASKRKSILKKFYDEEIDILITTDIMSRGIDKENITHVINYNIPKDIEIYTHRIGRCARGFNNEGTIIDLITPNDVEKYVKIINEKKIKPIIKEVPENLKEIEIKHEIKKRDYKKGFKKK